jgi:ribonuclease J
MQGVPLEKDSEAFLDEAVEMAVLAHEGWREGLDDLREKLRLAVRRCATRWTGKKPIVDVLIIES